MARKDRMWRFAFHPGEMMGWGFDTGPSNGAGLFDVKFSSIFATPKQYPGHGLVEGRSPDLYYGEFLPPEYATALRNPLTVISSKPDRKGKLPVDMATLGDGSFGQRPIVSSRLKAVIEQMEPGKHQFIPVGFADGRCEPHSPLWTNTDWYYFNLLNWVEAEIIFNLEAMGPLVETISLPDAHGYAGRKAVVFPTSPKKALVIRKRFIESNIHSHLFVVSSYFKNDLTFVLTEPVFLCTDVMKIALKDAGLKGGVFLELRMI